MFLRQVCTREDARFVKRAGRRSAALPAGIFDNTFTLWFLLLMQAGLFNWLVSTLVSILFSSCRIVLDTHLGQSSPVGSRSTASVTINISLLTFFHYWLEGLEFGGR